MNKIHNTFLHNYNISMKGNVNSAPPDGFNKNKFSDNNTEYMSSEASSASRAYGLCFMNKNKTLPQISLNEMIKWLESQGKVEGKDFEIDSTCTMGNTVLYVMNEKGKPELTIHYDNGNHASWSGYETTEYKNGEKYKEIGRDYNGNINTIEQSFKNDDITIQHLFENGLTYDTTPEDYIRQLQENNIKYSIEYSGEEDNNRSVNIDVFDDNNNLNHRLWFYYGNNKFDEHCKWVSRSEYNEKQKEHRRVCFDKDKIEVVTYINYL